MHRPGVIVFLFACVTVFCSASDFKTNHQYCVIGAGPGGLQMAHFLQEAGRDYIVYEKGPGAGTFYTKFPIHRTLISINKRNTGKTNKEFNLRHDWNSLISTDESLQMGLYSKEFFPHADIFVKYLNDYAEKLKLNIKYNTTVGNIGKRNPEDNLFHINDQAGNDLTCNVIVVATGIAKPNFPEEMKDVAIPYHDLTLDLEPFEGKSVLILGRGNSAFETAQHIMPATNFIHLISRSRARMAWSTHYVGDLRAVNNGLLDTYQLKSLDGLLEGDISSILLKRNEIDGRLYLDDDQIGNSESSTRIDNDALREGYDLIVSCLGFKFDNSIFNESATVRMAGKNRLEKYPRITYQYESTEVPGVFYAGTNTHSLDYRKSAGGFIHGFRYTTRTLHRILENRYHDVAWPSVHFETAIDVIPHALRRLSEASDIYQMFSVLCEVIIFSENELEATYLEAYPCVLASRIPQVSGHKVAGKVIIVAMEYGKNASGPGKDVFHEDRATGSASEAHVCNFLHPVFYYYSKLPTDDEVLARPKKWILPVPDRIHHVVEDFTTVFDASRTHHLQLRRFVENILSRDLRIFYADQCMVAALTHATLPESCRAFDRRGRGLVPNPSLKAKLNEFLPWHVQRLGVHAS